MDMRSTFAIGCRMIFPSLVMTTTWLFSTVTRRTEFMSRSIISPSLVTMMRRWVGAGVVVGGAAGWPPFDGCVAVSVRADSALARGARRRGVRAARRLGAGFGVAASVASDSDFVSSEGFAAVSVSAGLVSLVSALVAPGCGVAPALALRAPGLVPAPRLVAADELRLAGLAADGDGEGVGLASSFASPLGASTTGSSMRAPVEVTR